MTSSDIIQNSGRFYIGGEWVTGTGGQQILARDSATEEVYATVAEATEADVNRAVAAARHAFDTGPWPRMLHAERAIYLRRLADELDKRTARHAEIWTRESGVLHSAAVLRMAGISASYRQYAAIAETYPFQERRPSQTPGITALLVREAVGVVAAIVPWNGAPGLITSKVAPALLAGCTVIVKAAPEAPGSAYILAEAAEAAGIPEGVINILTADRAVSEALVRHPGVDKVAFTGSTLAGRRIAALSGEKIGRVTLELGGKSPAIILEDYDIATAAKSLASSAVFLSGQVCAALTRVLVPRPRHAQLVEALNAEFAAVTVGDPFAAATGMGPLASARQRDRVEGYIAQGVAQGATLAFGGGRPKHLERGYFVEPTVFANVDNAQTIAREEIFGPVLTVIPVDGADHAVDVANDTIFGLNAAVFTNDADRAYAIARRLRSGTVGHNAYRSEPNIAFGGFKQSGLGREGGTEGLMPYLETKVIALQQMPATLPPYTDLT